MMLGAEAVQQSSCDNLLPTMPDHWPQHVSKACCTCQHRHHVQVQVDAPRTAPEVAFFAQPAMQQVLQRVLYLWGIRY